MLNMFDTLAWKARYLAGDVKAHLYVGYSCVRNLIFQLISDPLAFFHLTKAEKSRNTDVMFMRV